MQTTRKALQAALDALARVIPTRAAVPSLTALLATPSGDGLVLSGTNLEVDLRVPVPGELGLMAPTRPFAVPAHLLHQTVKRLAGNLVELELEGHVLHVRSAGNSTRVQLIAADELSPLSFPEHGGGVPVDGEALARGLRSVHYACTQGAFQPVFKGVLLRFGPKGTTVVASDGYRVALYTAPGAPEAGEVDLIVPGRSVEELARLLDGSGAQMHLGPGLASVTRPDGGALNVKLLDGDFPDYARVIPKACMLSVQTAGAPLLEALDRAALYADANANHRLELLAGDGRLRLHAENDYGQADESVEATISGTEERLSIAVNAEMTAEALRQMLPGDVRIEFSGSTSPMIFRSAGDAAPMAVTVALRE